MLLVIIFLEQTLKSIFLHYLFPLETLFVKIIYLTTSKKAEILFSISVNNKFCFIFKFSKYENITLWNRISGENTVYALIEMNTKIGKDSFLKMCSLKLPALLLFAYLIMTYFKILVKTWTQNCCLKRHIYEKGINF